MVRQAILWIIWLGFVAYTLWLTPLDQPYTWQVARKLLTLQWNDLNAYLPAIFSLMGLIFPISTLFDDDLARRGIHNPYVFWAVAVIPLFGPLVYLCLRPKLFECGPTPA